MTETGAELYTADLQAVEEGLSALEVLPASERALKNQLSGILRQYESLVRESVRTLSLADRIQNKLITSNQALEESQMEIRREKDRYESLLLSIFPETIARELMLNQKVLPRRFEQVTVMFTDFVSFTELAAKVEPELLLGELNDLFCAFDFIIRRNGCERVKTIGDGYMAMCGVPMEDPLHARRMVKAAFEFLDYIHIRNRQLSGRSLDIRWQIRIGIHSGPVVGGIVGLNQNNFDIFGDTVNLASRIEKESHPMAITVSEETKNLLGTEYTIGCLGKRKIKGKGLVCLYRVER